MPITLQVNHRPRTVDVPPDSPLLWVLRDHLDLKAAKYGCGIGACGACTVLLDGRPVRACTTPVSAIGTRPILTLEGLAEAERHPVLAAWEELDVPQCGYCQAGQIASAAALLNNTPHPTNDDIDDAMSGNLCRCGTYPRIRQAIHRAAELQAKGGTR
ncbi:(2Fe-2S)-binding protein [Acidobacteria bacterium AB60]|nr:(2Fe-2S)-binding protein [Acidobacteria bacterium AB60]